MIYVLVYNTEKVALPLIRDEDKNKGSEKTQNFHKTKTYIFREINAILSWLNIQVLRIPQLV